MSVQSYWTGVKGLNFIIHFVENAQDILRNGDNLSNKGTGMLLMDTAMPWSSYILMSWDGSYCDMF